MKGGLVGWGHSQFRDVMGEFSRKAWNNCTWEPVVWEASQRARDGAIVRPQILWLGVSGNLTATVFLIPVLYILAALDVKPNTSLTRMPSRPLPVKR